MRNLFIEKLLAHAKENQNIFFITGDLGYGVVDSFAKQLPNQFINCGISEQNMIGIAAGLAATGKKVYVYSIGNFPTMRCLEQIRNDVCLMNNDVTIVAVGAGYAYGPQGYSHHALEDIAVMRALPTMNVLVPSTLEETATLLDFTVANSGPKYLRLGKTDSGAPTEKNFALDDFKFNKIRTGKDGTILFSGPLYSIVLEAALLLQEDNFDIGIYSVPFVSKIDEEEFRKIAKCGPIVTVEEHSTRGGFGSAVLEFASENNIKANISLVASSQSDISKIGSQEYLRNYNGIRPDIIASKFKIALGVS